MDILSGVGSIAAVLTTLAVVAGVIIYKRQLEAMTRARELESLLVIMKYVDDISLRRARYFMLENWEKLSDLLEQPFSWDTRHAIESRMRELSSGTLGVDEIDLAINALNNVSFLVRNKYAPAEAVESFMKNSLLYAWRAFEPYIRSRRTQVDTIGQAEQYGAHFEWIVQMLRYSQTSPNPPIERTETAEGAVPAAHRQ
jgi:hypothetical protein